MEKASCIIKRHGHEEAYDERKLYASVYSAARATHKSEVEAELIAEKVTNCVTAYISDGSEVCVESGVLFKKTIECTVGINKDVAFMYETHRDVS